MANPVSASQVADIQLRLANISSSLLDNEMEDNDMEDQDQFEARKTVSNEEYPYILGLGGANGLPRVRARDCPSYEDRPREKSGDLGGADDRDRGGRLGEEVERAFYHFYHFYFFMFYHLYRLRGLVMRVNQFQQNILQVQINVK